MSGSTSNKSTVSLRDGGGESPPFAPIVSARVVGTSLAVDLPVAGKVWIGTSTECALRVSSPYVTKHHCSIERVGAKVMCKDNKSHNGIKRELKGERLDELELEPNVPFLVGDVRIVGETDDARRLRRRIQRWVGHAGRFQAVVDDALDAALWRKHVIIAGPKGAGHTALARVLHDGLAPGARPFVEAAAGPLNATAQQRLLDQAAHGSVVLGPAVGELSTMRERLRSASASVRLIIIAAGPSVPTTIGEVGSVVPGVMMVHLPPVAERRDDLVHLFADLLAEVAERYGLGDVDVSGDMPKLFAYGWPNNVDEIEATLSYVLASAKHKSLRKMEKALGVSKSTFDDALKRVGIRTQK